MNLGELLRPSTDYT